MIAVCSSLLSFSKKFQVFRLEFLYQERFGKIHFSQRHLAHFIECLSKNF